jgi:hypothetical protein
MNFKNKTIYKYFLINQFKDLDVDIKNEIKRYVKIRFFKAPTYNELNIMMVKKDGYFEFINKDDIVFCSHHKINLCNLKVTEIAHSIMITFYVLVITKNIGVIWI